MTPDPFETRLAATPMKDLPPEWRDRILLAARDSQRQRWALLWPSPHAWGAIAACWIAIALLLKTGPTEREAYTFVPAGMEAPTVSAESYFAYVEVRDSIPTHEPEGVWFDRSKL